MNAFLKRPLSGGWPHRWLNAIRLKMREGGRIVSVAAIIAVAVATKGRREIIGLHLGLSKAEVFWTDLMRDVAKRRLAGVKLVISEAHEGAEKRRPPCRGRHLAEVPCALGEERARFRAAGASDDRGRREPRGPLAA